MNFFQAQTKARHNTRLLTLLFAGAVISLVVLTNLLVLVFFVNAPPGTSLENQILHAPPQVWLYTSLGVVGLIAVASGFKFLALQGGGQAVAKSLGGILIHQNTRDPQQRQLLNVVEEMAIAAGMPVPPVYLIRENSINAFAAGFSIHDAVIGINQGTIDLLNRHELQGVVAHEFSHILNGDMRINLRIIALLNGILVLGIIGGGLMRGSMFSRSRDRGGLIALGIGLLVIGYGGTFFGQLIKAAVSRQREYLADASAVQFTRSAQGIASALKKIGAHRTGSQITSPQADENSHLFFGAIRSFSSMMATHPPLEARIKALDPNWAPTPASQIQPSLPDNPAPAGASNFSGGQSTGPISQFSGSANLAAAQQMIDTADPSLSESSHDTFEARAMVYAMLLSKNESFQAEQLRLIGQQAENGVPPLVPALFQRLSSQNQRHKLLHLERAMPTLKEMSHQQYLRFYDLTAKLIVADQAVDLFEWVAHRMITQELYAHFVKPQRSRGRIARPGRVSKQVTLILSLLATVGSSNENERRVAYQRGQKIWGGDLPMIKLEYFDHQALNQALEHLRELNPALQERFLDACASVVNADNKLTGDEFSVIKGVAVTLGCPLPPI